MYISRLYELIKCIKVKLPVQTVKYLATGPDRGTVVVIKSKLLLTAAQGTYSSSLARYLVMFRGTVYLMYPPLEEKKSGVNYFCMVLHTSNP